jgi:hypothetical protein
VVGAYEMSKARFRLHAFVCDRENVLRVDHIGWMTLQQLWSERASGCRYAVVETLDGRIQLWDLFHEDWDEWLSSGTEAHTPPGRAYTDIDAAISAALLRYSKGIEDDT